MEVSRLNLVSIKYDSDDMEVEYSVDNPNSYTLDRGALADEVGQAGWTVKHYAIYKDALTIDAFWTVEAKSDAGLISPEMDLSKDVCSLLLTTAVQRLLLFLLQLTANTLLRLVSRA